MRSRAHRDRPVQRAAAAAALLLASAAGTGLAAQTPAATAGQAAAEARGRGSISGAVLEAGSGAPIAGATVVLQPEMMGAFPGPATGSAFAAATRTVSTDSTGGYRFNGIPAGVYRLYVSRFSYRPYSFVVDLPASAESSISVGLSAEPIALRPVRARSVGPGPYRPGAGVGDDDHFARLLATDLRRHRYLTTDVRELTHADVVEAVTLGEPDLFRALQRLPGVATRSDYTAELWTRGAPWFQTRVYYDGVPLFNPLHALGLISGISSSAVGAVWFHPGVRSAGMGEGAAGIIDLQSRRAEGAGELNAQADLSLMTAGLALDQRVLDGRAGWMLSGRRSYLDWLSGLASRAAGRDDGSFPFGFAEVAGRVDAWVGEATALEASWLWEGDHITSADDAEAPVRSEWGNTLGRVTLTTRLRGLHARHTLAGSMHGGRVAAYSHDPATIPTSSTSFSRTAVRFAALSGSFWPEPTSLAGPPWTFGYSVEQHAVGYDGPIALPIPRSALASAGAESDFTGVLDSTHWSGSLPIVAAWGERTWSAGDRLSLRAGLRVEGGTPVRNGGALRPAPRLSVRYAPLSDVALSAGYGRVYQYTQAVAPGGVHLASMLSTDVWVLASEVTPAIRSDILTAGLEAWIGPARIVSLNAFGRRATGVALPDPRPGPVFGRAGLVAGENAAYGIEASVRQLTGRLTGSASYALTRSDVDAVGIRFPSAADRTHVFNGTLMYRALRSLRVGAATTAATGVPFTRMISTAGDCEAEPGCDPERLPWATDPHALRAPTHLSLDLLVDWATRVRDVEIGAFLQLRNVLGRENGTIYTGGGAGCLTAACDGGDLRDVFEPGLPRLPVIGVRVRR